MNRFNRLTLLFLLAMAAMTAQGQSTNVSKVFQSTFKKAEEMYDHLAYRNALELYLAVVEKDSSNFVARQRAADCYFRIGNIAEAERWYASLATTPGVPPQYLYQYAQVLTIQRKYPEAQKWFTEYGKVSGDTRAKSKLEFIEHLNYYFRDSVLYEIRNLPFNSDQSDFAPQYFPDGMVFVSARDRDLFIKHTSSSALNDKESMLNIYFAPKSAAEERDAVFFHNEDLNSTYHDGPIAFYDKNRKAAFSRSNLAGGKPVAHSGRVNLKLYFGELDAATTMKNIEPFSLNNNAYSIGHPWVAEDGNTLYFSSNQPGGEGGVDIYRTVKKNGNWDTPENLGRNINTMGDEFYPFLTNDSTLYFSASGHGGLGGLDIYVSHKRKQVWSNPENLGFPLNTSSDDFSLVMDPSGRKGMFSSNRPGGVGYDDIYTFQVKSFFVTGRTVEKNDRRKPVPRAKVTVLDKKGQPIDSTQSDDRGYFHVDLDFDSDFEFMAAKADFSWLDTVKFSTHTRVMGKDSIILPLWKHDLFASGIIFSNESQDKLSEVTVTLKNITDGRVDSIVTNAAGTYHFLLKPDKKYVISATKEGFISREFELNTKGITSGDLLNDMVLEEVYQEKVVIQFEFDKWEIRDVNHASLDEVVRVMKRNRKYHLHIGAYADARGTHEYNQNLSDKRARETVKYLVDHGVDGSRITATGFGEALHLNQCSNGVICSDEEHAKNRRAELKVQLGSASPTSSVKTEDGKH